MKVLSLFDGMGCLGFDQDNRACFQDGKSGSLDTKPARQKVLQLNTDTESGGKQPYQQNRVYDINGISPCLNTDARAHAIQSSDYRIRRLTPNECARLQTIPEWYNWGDTSDTQKYRMLGNGWTIEVIKHILFYAGLH